MTARVNIHVHVFLSDIIKPATLEIEHWVLCTTHVPAHHPPTRCFGAAAWSGMRHAVMSARGPGGAAIKLHLLPDVEEGHLVLEPVVGWEQVLFIRGHCLLKDRLIVWGFPLRIDTSVFLFFLKHFIYSGKTSVH